MVSVVQVITSLPPFQKRYAAPVALRHWSSVSLPASCLDCQVNKLADGLLSGRYLHQRCTAGDIAVQRPLSTGAASAEAMPPPIFQEDVTRPRRFRNNAPEFLTLSGAMRAARGSSGTEAEREPTGMPAYRLEQHLQCPACAGVSYGVDAHDMPSVSVPAREIGRSAEGRTTCEEVPLTRCVGAVLGTEGLEYKCRRDVVTTRQAHFTTFPDIFVAHAKTPSYTIGAKNRLHLGKGLQPWETELQDNAPSGTPGMLPEFNQAVLVQLEAIGFPLVWFQNAPPTTGNSGPELATKWLFVNVEDPDIDDPIVIPHEQWQQRWS
ncbi:hypothetical protein BJY52DRAFT_1215650 [Lactarius psammicola]|nr:hypothetical protein BJY52DRAFT_1215650 [Lactarius psammicola]